MEDALFLKYNTNDIINMTSYGKEALLIDGIYEDSNGNLFGKKLFDDTSKEFDGHFKSQSILPGIYILEGMFQTSLFCNSNKTDNKILRIIDAKFREAITPGSELVYHVFFDGLFFNGVAKLNNKIIAECKFV